MDYAVSLVTAVQLFFIVIIGVYFLNLLRTQQGNRYTVERESRKEIEKLQQLRSISLSQPLTEKTRPATLAEIVGQDEGLKALRAALCGPNPQHVLLYGPPGVGKTAAARLILEEAKRNDRSPFKAAAKMIEVDATTSRFDERGIADPLIGTVHDPIYQGAGAMGIAGIPQPKAGAVTKAHGGVLFIDEIGELHHMQMNKLLKVLEDRRVFLESSYYSTEDANIPVHIHDIFQNGLPADFRLVGATTRLPGEIPAAVRSRCVEIFFRSLLPGEIGLIAYNAARRINFVIADDAVDTIKTYCTNGREVVNLIQIAAGLAQNEKREEIVRLDVEWVVNFGQLSPRPDKKPAAAAQVGVVCGLAVHGANQGAVTEIEATAAPGSGRVMITGIVEEEEITLPGRVLRRRSMAKNSVDNVLTVLSNRLKLAVHTYDLHVNFPGGIPIDGPSAGVTMAVAVYSAMSGRPVDSGVAMTGELSLTGAVRGVGGVRAKLQAAEQAGIRRVLIPRENWQGLYTQLALEVVGISTVEEALQYSLLEDNSREAKEPVTAAGILAAAAK